MHARAHLLAVSPWSLRLSRPPGCRRSRHPDPRPYPGSYSVLSHNLNAGVSDLLNEDAQSLGSQDMLEVTECRLWVDELGQEGRVALCLGTWLLAIIRQVVFWCGHPMPGLH